MNDPQVVKQMELYQSWASMPLEQAKDEMRCHMVLAGIYDALDFELLNVSESIDEAVGAVYGI